MTGRVLIALLGGRQIGRVEQGRAGRLSLAYDDGWRRQRSAVPLSLSLPLSSATHGHAPVAAYLWGLLPDSEIVLERWSKRFHVSARNPFALLAHVGEECAGAVQFVAPERLDALTRDAAVEWLEAGDVAKRLAMLRADPSAWRADADTGQFSLAGAQAKTALLWQGGRWGVPSGRMPTSHILKPPIPGFDGHVENEHLCLRIARGLGLPAASSEVRWFGGEVAIVLERFDRAWTAGLAAAAAAAAATAAAEVAGAPDSKQAAEAAKRAAEAAARATALGELAKNEPLLRLHQEDLCQALAILPTSKYENEGGPGARGIVALLRAHSSAKTEDVHTFVDALALNWLLGATDGHAKNYSLLHGGGGRVRLAPLYDIGSALPYHGLSFRKLKLAMQVGGKYRLAEIGLAEWRKLATGLGLAEHDVVDRAKALAARLPEAAAAARDDARRQGLDHPVVDRLTALIQARARACARSLAA